MTSTTTLGSTKRACGSRILKADGCWLLVVCVGVSIALSRSPCLISVLSPCALLPFYLSVVVTVSVAVLGVVVVIAQDPAPALVAVTVFVPAVVGIHACTRACAHDLHTASDCPACAYIPGGNVESQMCLYQQAITRLWLKHSSLARSTSQSRWPLCQCAMVLRCRRRSGSGFGGIQGGMASACGAQIVCSRYRRRGRARAGADRGGLAVLLFVE